MILYFSGTGNSRLVALQLLTEGVSGPVVAIPDINEPISDTEEIIWVFPVYGWRVPDIVADAVRCYATGRRNYMVVTCGDDIGRTAERWRKLVITTCGVAAGCFSVQMPNTYVCLPGFDVDSARTVTIKLQAMPERVKRIASMIIGGFDGDDVVTGFLPGMKSGILGGFFKRFLMSPDNFRVDVGLCNGCGRCMRLCPLSNIHLCENRPRWDTNCAFCLACYHSCPAGAITHGFFSRGKGHYLAPRSLDDK